MNKRSRRHFSGPEKVAAVRRHLLEKVPVSDLCEELGIQVTLFYSWQKLLFERGAAVFDSASTATMRRAEDAKDQKISQLQAKLQQKNEVVAELLQEHVQLKKELGEL